MIARAIALSLAVMLSFCGCTAYSTLGLVKLFPSRENPKYGLYVELTPLENQPDGVLAKTLLAGNIEQWEKDGPILFKFKRKILLPWPVPKTTMAITAKNSSLLAHTPSVTGGMEGQRIWVKVQDHYNLAREWLLETERTPSGKFELIKEKGEFLSR
jgi:hypothetical protein